MNWPTFHTVRSTRSLLLFLSLVSLALIAGCGDERPESEVRLVAAAGPLTTRPASGTLPSGADTERIRPIRALKFFLDRGSGRDAATLLLTGDLVTGRLDTVGTRADSVGYTPPWRTYDSLEAGAVPREGVGIHYMDTLAARLADLPVSRILVLPGGPSAAGRATDAGVAEADTFLDRVIRSLRGRGPQLSILTRCYTDEAAGIEACGADLGERHRIVGFPSGAFTSPADPTRRDVVLQAEHLATLSDLVDRAEDDGRSVLVATHVPYLEWKEGPGGLPPGSAARSWSAPDSLIDRWSSLVNREAVAGVLAGHLHDWHRDLYRWPWTWSAGPGVERGGKLFLVPPLTAVGQIPSRTFARGVRLVAPGPDGLASRLYWLDPGSDRLRPDAAMPPLGAQTDRARRPFWRDAGAWAVGAVTTVFWKAPKAVVLWLWNLPVPADGRDPITDFGRALVFLLAGLFVVLTFVDFWRLSNPRDGDEETSGKSEADERSESQKGSAEKKEGLVSRLPFESNLANTASAGLLGLFSVSAIGGMVEALGGNATGYYVAVFIGLFLLELVFIAVVRGIVEAVRIRQILVHRAPSPPTISRPPEGPALLAYPVKVLLQWLAYWISRVWRWFLSLRPSFLAFADTSVHFLMGRNQARTEIFEQKVQQLHCSIIDSLVQVRRQLRESIKETLECSGCEGLDETDVRVNISILSPNRKELRYIPFPAAGSLAKTFGRDSVAWVSVYSGEDRWWKKTYQDRGGGHDTVALFPASCEHYARAREGTRSRDPLLPADRVHTLADKFQPRRASNYEAFAVIPIPRKGRAPALGAIHISFRWEELFDCLWNVPSPVEETDGDGRTTHEIDVGCSGWRWIYRDWDRFLDVSSGEDERDTSPDEAGGQDGDGEATNECCTESREATTSLKDERESVRDEIYRAMEVLEPLLKHFNEGIHQLKARDCDGVEEN